MRTLAGLATVPTATRVAHDENVVGVMSYNEHKRCSECNTVFLNGTPHSCAIDSVDAGRAGLEAWLGAGDFQVEDVDPI